MSTIRVLVGTKKGAFIPNSEIGMGSAAAPAAVRRALAPNSEASDHPKRWEHFAPPSEPRGRGSLRPRRARSPKSTSEFGFILTNDGARRNWEVSGPHFAGWEMYHLKGSSVDPNRLYASQSSGWFGQVIQRSDDGGKK